MADRTGDSYGRNSVHVLRKLIVNGLACFLQLASLLVWRAPISEIMYNPGK